MSKITNLNHYHEVKRLELIIEELEDSLEILNLTTKGLGLFKHYKAIGESLIQLTETKMIMRIHLKKCKELLRDQLEET